MQGVAGSVRRVTSPRAARRAQSETNGRRNAQAVVALKACKLVEVIPDVVASVVVRSILEIDQVQLLCKYNISQLQKLINFVYKFFLKKNPRSWRIRPSFHERSAGIYNVNFIGVGDHSSQD